MSSSLNPRIKNIQKAIQVEVTGNFDPATINKLLSIMQVKSADQTLQAKKEAIQKKLGFTGKAVDGIFGVNTTTRLEFYVSARLPSLPPGANMIVSKKGLNLVIESEISSEPIYRLKHKKPVWPKGKSGITIGIGYDLGYTTAAKIENDWEPVLPATDVKKLKAVAGLKGKAAGIALANNNGDIRSVTIPFESAKAVFYISSLPAYAKLTRTIYPGIDKLPPDAQAALLSMVYNRGSGLKGDKRREMKNIVKLADKADLKGIAAEIRSMKRLWTSPETKGLLIRRENEAVLVENAGFFYNPDEIIFL
ncbi:MAG: hypothetical protein IPO42_12855 [Chitinophagaceae bacterium]|nr:hypothetical protein [Chitinophagaceae bacterium]